MGGRGSTSRSGSSSIGGNVERYGILTGSNNVERLRNVHGISDAQISRIYEEYQRLRRSGVGRRNARIRAEGRYT